jgi:hypothetical protein
MKSFTPIAFPERDHPVLLPPPEAAAQRAFPEASLVRTYPFDAPESILRPWKVPVPTTSSKVDGDDVPIPTFAPVPKMSAFELETRALYQIAVALKRYPVDTLALAQIKVFQDQVVFVYHAVTQSAVL